MGMCMGGYCGKCHGGMKLVARLLVLANVYWLNWEWWTFVGALLVLAGVVKMAKPMCPCCEADMKKKK